MKFPTKEQLAQSVIRNYLLNRQVTPVSKSDVPSPLHKKGAAFVTIYVDNNLRGCIGDYLAYEPIYKNIVRNSINALTRDFRFQPVSLEELPLLKVEISLLSPLKQLKMKDTKKLLFFLDREKPGILLENGGRKALFLPQVWEDLPDPTDFLYRLSLKAGLETNAWQDKSTRFWYFTKIKDN